MHPRACRTSHTANRVSPRWLSSFSLLGTCFGAGFVVSLALLLVMLSARPGGAASAAVAGIVNPTPNAVYDLRALDNLIRVRGIARFVIPPSGSVRLTGVFVRVLRGAVTLAETMTPAPPGGGAFQVALSPVVLAGPNDYSVEVAAVCSDGSVQFPPSVSTFRLVDASSRAGPVLGSFEITADGAISPFDPAASGAAPAPFTVTNRLAVDLHGVATDLTAGAAVTEFRAANVDPVTDQVLGPQPNFGLIPFVSLPGAPGNPRLYRIPGWLLAGTSDGTNDGLRGVVVQFRDSTGVTSAVYKRGMLVDGTPPGVVFTSPAAGQFITGRAFVVQGQISDALAGVREASFRLEMLDSVTRNVLGGPVDQAPVTPGADGGFRVTTAVPRDGEFRITIQALDFAGNTRTASVEFIVDTTPPTVNIREPRAACVGSPVNIAADVRDANFNPSAVIINVNNGAPLAFTDTPDPAEPVLHRLTASVVLPEQEAAVLRVRATDRAGFAAGDERTFAVDQAPPSARLTQPTPGRVYTGDLRVLGELRDSLQLQKYELLLDGAAAGSIVADVPVAGASAPVDFLIPRSRLPDGPHTLLLRATDRCGRTSAIEPGVNEIRFSSDSTPPLMEFVAPDPNDPDSRPDPNAANRLLVDVKATLADPNLDPGRVVLRVDEVATTGFLLDRVGDTTTLTVTLSLAEGRHVLRLDAADNALPQPNVASRTLEFLLDPVPPTAQVNAVNALAGGVINATAIPGVTLAAGRLEILGTVSDRIGLSRAELLVDDVTFQVDRSLSGRTGDQAVRFELDTALLQDGDHELVILATDQAGNVTESNPRGIRVDNARPDIRILAPVRGAVVRGDPPGALFEVQVGERHLRRVTLRVGALVLHQADFPRPGEPLQNVTIVRVIAPVPQGRDLTLTVEASDLVQNAANPITQVFTSDTEDPAGAVLTIAPGGGPDDVVSSGLEPPVVRGSLQIGGLATDSLALAQAQLLVDGAAVATRETGSVTAFPVTFPLDTGTLIEGRHTLRLQTTDTAQRTNLRQTNNTRDILVDRSAPSAILLEPLADQVRGVPDGPVLRLNVSGRVRDNIGPLTAPNVRLTLTGVSAATGMVRTIEPPLMLTPTSVGSATELDARAGGVDITDFRDGEILIELRVTDAVGLTGVTSRRVVLNRTGPTLDFVKPATFARFLGNSVQQVRFRLDDTDLASATPGGAARKDRLTLSNIRVLVFDLKKGGRNGGFVRGNRVIETRTISDLRKVAADAPDGDAGTFPSTEEEAGVVLQFNLRLAPGRYRRNQSYLIQVLGVTDSNGNAIDENKPLRDNSVSPDGGFTVFFR